jgi:hypothetical protein
MLHYTCVSLYQRAAVKGSSSAADQKGARWNRLRRRGSASHIHQVRCCERVIVVVGGSLLFSCYTQKLSITPKPSLGNETRAPREMANLQAMKLQTILWGQNEYKCLQQQQTTHKRRFRHPLHRPDRTMNAVAAFHAW